MDQKEPSLVEIKIKQAEEIVDSLHHTEGKITLSRERQEDESYDEYKIRMKLINAANKTYLKGRNIFHTSKYYGFELKGKTYIKPTNK